MENEIKGCTLRIIKQIEDDEKNHEGFYRINVDKILGKFLSEVIASTVYNLQINETNDFRVEKIHQIAESINYDLKSFSTGLKVLITTAFPGIRFKLLSQEIYDFFQKNSIVNEILTQDDNLTKELINPEVFTMFAGG